jgi:hypothetical protein
VEAIRILAAFAVEDALLFGEFIEAVEHAPHLVEVVDPRAWSGGIGPPEAKVLRLVAHLLVEEPACFVDVVIGANDAAPGWSRRAARVRKVRDGATDRVRDLFAGTAGVTFDDELVLTVGERERRAAIIVRGTLGIPPGPVGARLRALDERRELCGGHAGSTISVSPGPATRRMLARCRPHSIQGHGSGRRSSRR